MCTVCGAQSTHRQRHLAKPCKGAPPLGSQARKTRNYLLKDMRARGAGRVTNPPNGPERPVTMEARAMRIQDVRMKAQALIKAALDIVDE